MTVPGKCHNHEGQPTRSTKRRRDKQIRTTETPNMKWQTQRRASIEDPPWYGRYENHCGMGQLQPFLFARNLSLNSNAAPNYNKCLVGVWVLNSFVKHHSETHTTNYQRHLWNKVKGWMAIWSQHTRKLQAGAWPQTLIVKHRPSKTDSVRGPTHLRAVKEGSKVINHTWDKNHVCSSPQNVYVVTYFFLKLYWKISFVNKLSEFID